MSIRDFKDPIVVYHHPCHDGITCLAIAQHYYGAVSPVLGCYDGTPLPKPRLFEGLDVLFVDYCYDDMGLMREIAAAAHNFAVVDHHETAERKLRAAGFPDHQLYFDMQHSGAGLLWKLLRDDAPPPLVASVEDRDLWRFALPNTRSIHAACDAYPLTLEARQHLLEQDINTLAQEGAAIQRYHDKLVAGIVVRATHRYIDGYLVPYIELPALELVSDVGHALAKGQPFAAIGLRGKNGLQISLRSDPNGLNVATIAERFGGGGGHAHAAGYLERTT